MTRRAWLRGASIVSALEYTAGGQVPEPDLANRLSNPHTRESTLNEILGSPNKYRPTLLRWAAKLPRTEAQDKLKVAMADAFGEWKTVEAIPFLIENIDLHRDMTDINVWLKAEHVILRRLPCVGALVKVGRPAALALIDASIKPLTQADRLAVVFTVGQISHAIGVDEELRTFLRAELAWANQLRFSAEPGLQ